MVIKYSDQEITTLKDIQKLKVKELRDILKCNFERAGGTKVAENVEENADNHAWKFLCQFWPSFVSPFPQSSSLKFCAVISPARQERKSVRLYRHVRENWY